MKKLISTNSLSHKVWLKYRKQGIGGSDADAICGLNPYASPISVFYISAYKESNDVSFGDTREFLNFNKLKDKVAFKLIQREKNQEILKEVPYIEFLDLAVVFYLILDEHKGGQMTALIHNSHMEPWGAEKEELYCLAMKNTPILLPSEIKTMK